MDDDTLITVISNRIRPSTIMLYAIAKHTTFTTFKNLAEHIATLKTIPSITRILAVYQD